MLIQSLVLFLILSHSCSQFCPGIPSLLVAKDDFPSVAGVDSSEFRHIMCECIVKLCPEPNGLEPPQHSLCVLESFLGDGVWLHCPGPVSFCLV